jgi:hypothetical protein
VILLKWFVWKLLLEVDAVTVASGGSSLSSEGRTRLVGTQLLGAAPAATGAPLSTPDDASGITFLGPVQGHEESSTFAVSRDDAQSVALLNGQDLWVFGDTLELSNDGTWVPSAFIIGSSAAEGPYSVGQAPTALNEVLVGHPLSAANLPYTFIPSPRDVFMPEGTGRSCNQANGRVFQARWATSLALMPDQSNVLVTCVEVCAMPANQYVDEGWGFMEFNWKTNRITRRPFDVFPPAKAGSALAPASIYYSPVISGGKVTLFSFGCTYLESTCSSVGAWETMVGHTLPANKTRSAYVTQLVTTAPSTQWEPQAVSVASYPGAGLRLVEQTSGEGGFAVFSAPTAIGPWSEVVSGTLPDCQSTTHGSCYAFVGHPELSSSSQIVISYLDPNNGPAGHLVAAAVPLGGG